MNRLPTLQAILRRLLPSVMITADALHRLGAELEAGHVIRGMYVNSQGAGCLMYWLIGCTSRMDRYNILAADPNRSVVTQASEDLIQMWDAAAHEPEKYQAAMTKLILHEIDRELVHRRRVNELEERMRQKALRRSRPIPA